MSCEHISYIGPLKTFNFRFKLSSIYMNQYQILHITFTCKADPSIPNLIDND